MAQYVQNATYSGLGTFAVMSAPEAANYHFQLKMSLPTISEGHATNSQVICLVKKNGSTVYTGNAGDEGFNFGLTLAANDAITLVLSSSAPVDQGLNRIKTNISISEGSL